MADDGTGTLGPGVLSIGATGEEIDVSCLVNNVTIEPDISEGDTKTMLCGTTKTTPDSITWSLSGNVDVDAGTDSGFFALTWQHSGEEVPFTYTPNTELGTTVTGVVKLVPLALGADNYGEYLNSDFEFPLPGFDTKTAVTYGPPVPDGLAATSTSTSGTSTRTKASA